MFVSKVVGNFLLYGILHLQEEELAVAASKFAECQKTIASLGRQLRALVTLDDFLIDSEKPLEHTGEGKNGGESWNLQATEFTFVA